MAKNNINIVSVSFRWKWVVRCAKVFSPTFSQRKQLSSEAPWWFLNRCWSKWLNRDHPSVGVISWQCNYSYSWLGVVLGTIAFKLTAQSLLPNLRNQHDHCIFIFCVNNIGLKHHPSPPEFKMQLGFSGLLMASLCLISFSVTFYGFCIIPYIHIRRNHNSF